MESRYIIEPPQVIVQLVFEPDMSLSQVTELIDKQLAVWKLLGVTATALIDHLTSQDIDPEVQDV